MLVFLLVVSLAISLDKPLVMMLVVMLGIPFPSLCFPSRDLLLMHAEKLVGMMTVSQEGVDITSTMTEKGTISPPVLVSKALVTGLPISDPSS